MTMKKGRSTEDGHKGAQPAPEPERRLLEGKVRAASRALLFEKLWPRVWLPLGIAGVFVLLSVLEVWQLLPPRIHSGLLVAFGIAFAFSLLPLFFWQRPSREKSFARLEKASALDHRPLTAFNDKLPEENPSPETLALWKAHRVRAAQALKKLRAGAPHPRIDKYDPFALRAALLLTLIAAGAWAWDDLGSRVLAAFKVPEGPAGAGIRIDAWISPPEYTRKDPFVLADRPATEAIAVPQGSDLTVKINAPDAAGYRVTLVDGKETQVLEPSGQSGPAYAEYVQTVEHSATLSVHRSFGTERSWALTVVPDRAPEIRFAGPVEVSPKGVMLFKYTADDDYGVVSAEARVERIAPAGDGTKTTEAPVQIGKPPSFRLSLPRAPVKSAEGKTYQDLTAHPWAGLPVVITLAARDEAGHTGYSAARGLILPERHFTKPLAKAIVGQRRALVENPQDTPRIAANLNALTISAADEGIPASIYLNLRSAQFRLKGPLPAEEIESVVDQLWDTAIRIEDGDLSTAERELRAAQEKLKDALDSGAPPEEIQRLMTELRQALSRYLQALAEQRSKKSNRGAASRDAKMVSPQDLQHMLDKIESLAKTGSAAAAAQMLNQLRDILESVQAGSPGGDDSEREQAERLKQLQQLTDIMRQQQQLLDRTFRARQGNEDGQRTARPGRRSGSKSKRQNDAEEGEGGQEGAETSGLKEEQDDIQRQLQELLSSKEAPDGDQAQRKLKEAEGAMGEASGAIEQNDLSEAGDQQGRALEAMRQSARTMAEQMMRESGRGGGNGQADGDPLGRNGNELNDSGKGPDIGKSVQRAREILDELRKRLGEPARPPLELDYLERLAKPY
jgi:uncharacterized protein (TIGR02302 family)